MPQHRHVQRQTKNVTPRFVQKLIVSVAKSCLRRLLTKEKHDALINKISIFISFTTRKLTVKAAWYVETSARGKLLVLKVVVSSVENYNSGKSNLKFSYIFVECSRFKVEMFVRSEEIASGNVTRSSIIVA